MKGEKSKRQRKPQNIDFESDGELDEDVDKFHKEDRKIASDAIKQKKKNVVEEVLNVEGDLSDTESEEDDFSDFGSDHEKDKETDLSITTDKWGRKRQTFYNTGYVDNDFGGVNSSDEEENILLEEEDAIARQKKLDEAGAAGLDDIWDNEVIQKTLPKVVEVKKEWKLGTVKKENETLVQLLQDFNTRRELYDTIVKPLRVILQHAPSDSPIHKQISLVHDVYCKFITLVAFYLHQKSVSFESEKVNDESIDSHPVMEEIDKLRKMLDKVDGYLVKNKDILDKLKKKADKGISITHTGTLQHTKQKAEPVVEEQEEVGDEEEGEGGEEEGKRGVGYAIQKNKQMKQRHKKKKDLTHARVKNRKKFEKAKIRRRSQVPDVRKEDKKYSGEARGIRASTVKSIKLIA